MKENMSDYYTLTRKILERGNEKDDRTGVGTLSLFGQQMRFDISDSFPLLTGKYTSFKMIATELLWFLSGRTDISFLHENDCHIWDEWVGDDGTFGPIYGKQWRNLSANGENIDQIKNVIERIKSNPESRRLIVSAWNVADVESGNMALAPCHILFQFYTREIEHNGKRKYALSCRVDQRSADMFLGVPYNIASYSLLTYIVASIADMVPDELIWHGGDCHIYKNHIDQANELLNRDLSLYPLPSLKLKRKIESIDDLSLSDFEVVGYNSHNAIKAPVAV